MTRHSNPVQTFGSVLVQHKGPWTLKHGQPILLPACPLCKRPNYNPSDHHLVPKSKGGTETTRICRDCHKTIHLTFTNNELRDKYHTVEALLEHQGFAKAVKFIAKQDGRVKVAKPRRSNGKP